jgi:hypothetical protein
MSCGAHGGREEVGERGASTQADLNKNKQAVDIPLIIVSCGACLICEIEIVDSLAKTKQTPNERHEPSLDCSNSDSCREECE